MLQVLSQVKAKTTFKDNIKPIEARKKVNITGGSAKSSDWVTHSYAEEVCRSLPSFTSFSLPFLSPVYFYYLFYFAILVTPLSLSLVLLCHSCQPSISITCFTLSFLSTLYLYHLFCFVILVTLLSLSLVLLCHSCHPSISITCFALSFLSTLYLYHLFYFVNLVTPLSLPLVLLCRCVLGYILHIQHYH